MSTPGTRPTRANDMLLLPSTWTYEAVFLTEAWILGFWAGVVPVISRTSVDSVCSFSLQYGSEELVSIVECYTSTFGSTDRLEGIDYGSRLRTWLSGRDFRDPEACLRHCTIG